MSKEEGHVETCQDLSLSAERPAVSLRQVSWLRGLERLLSAPRYGLPICGVADSGRIVRGFPITVAGPRRILTGFPFIPQWAPSAKTSTQYRRTSSVSSGTGIGWCLSLKFSVAQLTSAGPAGPAGCMAGPAGPTTNFEAEISRQKKFSQGIDLHRKGVI